MALALLHWLHGLLLATPVPDLEEILTDRPSGPSAVVVVVHGRTFEIRIRELTEVAA